MYSSLRNQFTPQFHTQIVKRNIMPVNYQKYIFIINSNSIKKFIPTPNKQIKYDMNNTRQFLKVYNNLCRTIL